VSNCEHMFEINVILKRCLLGAEYMTKFRSTEHTNEKIHITLKTISNLLSYIRVSTHAKCYTVFIAITSVYIKSCITCG